MNTLSATLEPESSAVNVKPLAPSLDSRHPPEIPFSPTWIARRAKRARIHINLLDGHWSMHAGHWSADLARRSASTAASPAQPRVSYVANQDSENIANFRNDAASLRPAPHDEVVNLFHPGGIALLR